MGDFDDLLDGLESDARESRERLLTRLRDDGVTDEELRRAVEEERLVLLPVERALRGDARYTGQEMAERAEVDVETLAKVRRAAGLPFVADGEPGYGEGDVEVSRRLKTALDAGLPIEGIVDVNRVMGRALAQTAAAMRTLVGDAVLSETDREDEAAERLVWATRLLLPNVGPSLEYFFAQHLLELIRTDVLSSEQLQAGRVGRESDTAVAFADLVGFTRLGGSVPAEDLGGVARRLNALAEDAVTQPVRIIKTIGDAVMLSCSQPEQLLTAVIELNDAVEEEGDDFPQLRTGIAFGPAIDRDGDLYGHAVNLASRVTDVARPGSVLATKDVKDAVADGIRWSYAGERRLKGVGEVKLFRARRAEEEGD
ncbi:MAG TPA: adenylate cyclase regulatory domain-containing protein [Solirubrobacteraceae bacterium]|nr:adenylate cyclase regulatory domain-containing protein [Solirubrobacteraceae bacterium]